MCVYVCVCIYIYTSVSHVITNIHFEQKSGSVCRKKKTCTNPW